MSMSEFELQTMLDKKFSTESFLTFEVGGDVLYENRVIGIWEELDANTMKATLFLNDEDPNDMTTVQVKKDKPITTSKENTMNTCKALVKGKEHGVKATEERDGMPVCKTHAKSKNVKFEANSKQGRVAIDQLVVNGALEQGAINANDATVRGITNAKSALEEKKESKAMKNVTVEEASQVSENVDIDKVQQFANELYGTNYRMGQTYIKVGANSGQALDNSKPGYIFCGSEYVGQVVKVNEEFFVNFDRGDNSEIVAVDQFTKVVEEKKEDAEVLVANVYYCNIFTPKNGKTIYYFTQEWKNVRRTRDDLVARAENALGRKTNKAIVMHIGEKWVVITKVVKDGQLITKSVFADEMDLRKNRG